MPAYTTSGPRARRSSLIALVIATAVLYLAADVLIPLAIAILLAFLAAPAVRRLERWKLPRLPATLVVSAVGFGVIFGIGAIAATQAVSRSCPSIARTSPPRSMRCGTPIAQARSARRRQRSRTSSARRRPSARRCR